MPKLEFASPLTDAQQAVLTPEAQQFLVELHARFNPRRLELLAAREERQKRLDAGEMPDFLPPSPATTTPWQVAPIREDLRDRRVEITGPVDRKMIINALNSGAKVFMADFEDASSPTWDNMLAGQQNLSDAVRRTISFQQGEKSYKLNDQVATLLVRPRGWHLPEKHASVDGQEMSGSLFDFGLYFFHNAAELLRRGSGPYFYLPKLESHLEARLWNDVFVFAQEYLGVPQGSIRATVLIETILATFELEEILYELRDHSAGLNCGRWDYIFSYIKKFREHPDKLLPDRAQVTMETPMMRNYSRLVIKTCHKHGAHAIGGMSAFIPVKNDEAANARASEQVRRDKQREASDGHDGTWVAHPGMVSLAMDVFDEVMPQPNQIDSGKQADFSAQASDLLTPPEGNNTEAGLRLNINVALQYLYAWLRGSGAVPIHNLMEDAATAEISRAQVWQQLRHATKLEGGQVVDAALVDRLLTEEWDKLGRQEYAQAAALFREVATQQPLVDFLTLSGYRELA